MSDRMTEERLKYLIEWDGRGRPGSFLSGENTSELLSEVRALRKDLATAQERIAELEPDAASWRAQQEETEEAMQEADDWVRENERIRALPEEERTAAIEDARQRGVFGDEKLSHEDFNDIMKAAATMPSFVRACMDARAQKARADKAEVEVERLKAALALTKKLHEKYAPDANAERDALRAAAMTAADVTALIKFIPNEYVVRVCEGGGPEDVASTLQVSVFKLVDAAKEATAMRAEVARLRQLVLDTARSRIRAAAPPAAPPVQSDEVRTCGECANFREEPGPSGNADWLGTRWGKCALDGWQVSAECKAASIYEEASHACRPTRRLPVLVETCGDCKHSRRVDGGFEIYCAQQLSRRTIHNLDVMKVDLAGSPPSWCRPEWRERRS